MPPFVQPVEQTIHTENEILDGYIVELLRHLSNAVPFTFDLQKVKDGDGMGRRHRDGTYSGVLGELIRKVHYKSLFQFYSICFQDIRSILKYLLPTSQPFNISVIS